MRKLTIVFHEAGGGHRSTAEALKATLTTQLHPWEVKLLNIQELLDKLDVLRKVTGVRIQDTYNLVLRRGWTRLSPQLLSILQRTIRLYHTPIVSVLRDHWAEHDTDLALSVIPHFNREIAESLSRLAPRPPFVTLLTDLADYPPHFWIERESEYLIAGSARAREQALAVGHPANRVFQTSGMVLKPRFYETPALDRRAERQRLGLDPDAATGIVLFGGHGSQVMVDIAKRLDQSGVPVQLILLCGHNQKLAAALKNLPTKKPNLVQGFTSDVQHYMALADFFIGKPGPGSISEALQFHLPVVTECNARTLPQERYNAQWLIEQGYGIVVNDFREIGDSVQRLLQPQEFEQFLGRVKSYRNRALFEVPAMLEQCWNAAQPQSELRTSALYP